MAGRVEIEFVSDRLAGPRLAQAYAIAVPEGRRLTGNERGSDDERRDHGEPAVGQGGGDLRAGVLRAPARGGNDRKPGPRAA